MGGIDTLRNKTPTRLPAGSKIIIKFTPPQPSNMIFKRLENGNEIELSIEDAGVILPNEKGIYYFQINAFWENNYDSSYVFAIETH